MTVVVPIIAIAALGASALVSWKTQYRTRAAQVLWLTCNVVLVLYATVVPLLFFGILFLFAMCFGSIPEFLVVASAVSLVVIYIIIRCFIVILLFYAFTALPAGTYRTESWFALIPSLH